ncbi:translation initiation factor IF-3 [candidate division WS5 bacterium]|uniref:Translation initiation factor IF-3 n=1 Tax=candidate division WS5 bacterium TaxID=2093353 RepID=A0A419DAV1_9BACT|nr:MAG: translation initiation factor IF-3 [candidate division WS5 bacterium]
MSINRRLNHQIKASQVRLIGKDGEQLGVVSLSEALRRAEEEGFDLVEISPAANPPVVKIIDWGKFKYEQQKASRTQKKKQKTVEVKGIRLSAKIGEHDLQTKAKHARKFLESGNKVKIRLFFKGREIVHKDIGENVLKKFSRELEDVAKIDQDITFSGREVSMILSPKKTD